jgi:hypothetical protein
MPTTVCPICGSTLDGQAADESQWYARFFPGTECGTVVPMECIDCAQELAVGDVVFQRDSGIFQRDSGTAGTITSILISPAGNKAYQVQFRNGSERLCIRSEISSHKSQGREITVSGDSSKKEGYF